MREKTDELCFANIQMSQRLSCYILLLVVPFSNNNHKTLIPITKNAHVRNG